MILPFGWNQFSEVDWHLFDLPRLAALFFIVVAGTFVAYSFNIYGLRHLGAGVTGSYIYTQPVFASLIAMIFLNEHFTIEKILAGLLIFLGVYLVSWKSKENVAIE